MEREVAWKKYDEAASAEVEALAADYIDFISDNKTERECAAAAIAAVRAASRDELFAVEADRAIAALAGVQPDGCDINKITGTGHVLPPLGGVANTKNRE